MTNDDATEAHIVAANSSCRHRDIKANGYYRILIHGARQIAGAQMISVRIQLLRGNTVVAESRATLPC